MHATAASTKPWFRHPEPWLLLAAPLAAILAGSYTWWIAASGSPSMVVDDYTKQGKAINQTLARDQRSAELGLQATLVADVATQSASLTIVSAHKEAALPEALRIQLIHATRAELDQQVWLRRVADDQWRGALAVPAGGRWVVQVDDGAGQWRLLKSVSSLSAPIELAPEPMAKAATGQPQVSR